MNCEKIKFGRLQRQRSEVECKSNGCELLLEEWEAWLTEKKEGRWKAERLQQDKARVEKLLASTEGGAGVLHNMAKPLALERRSTSNRRCL